MNILELQYRFAKTYTTIPHFYIVYENLSDKHKIQYNKMKKFIKEKGYYNTFYGKKYWYINIKGYKYWMIENILNREPLKVKLLEKDLKNANVNDVEIKKIKGYFLEKRGQDKKTY